MIKMMTLDIGSGDSPRALVNIDYRVDSNPEINQIKNVLINIKKIPNFIQADAQQLPFRDKCFGKTFCHHVIEHVDDPNLLIKEIFRVTKDNFEIRCPHRFSCHAKMPYHKHYFNKTWFARVFKKNKFDIDLTYWFPIPFTGFLRFPHEIRLEVYLDHDNTKKDSTPLQSADDSTTDVKKNG